MQPTPDYDDFFGIFVAIYLGILGLTLLLSAVYYVVMSITLMMFFRKVGVSPGIAWVPYYNYWKWLEVGGQPGWYSLLTLTGIGAYVTLVFLYIGMYRTGLAFGKSGSFVVLGIFLPFVWAYILGRREEVYRPETFAQLGFPPPLAGFGAVPMEQRNFYAYTQQQSPPPPYNGV